MRRKTRERERERERESRRELRTRMSERRVLLLGERNRRYITRQPNAVGRFEKVKIHGFFAFIAE